jgi:hypothetical protein
MEVLAVTIFCSVLLAGFFVAMFLGSQHGRRLGHEQEALLPLDDDFQPQTVRAPVSPIPSTTSPNSSQQPS